MMCCFINGWFCSGISPIMPVAMQEYLPRIKDNDVLRAVEKNTSGSRPKELFEEVLEDVEKQWDTDRYRCGNALLYMAISDILHQSEGRAFSSSFETA